MNFLQKHVGAAVLLSLPLLGESIAVNAGELDHYRHSLLTKSEHALQRGDATLARDLLRTLDVAGLQAHDRDTAWSLLCRVDLALGDQDGAAESCAHAVAIGGVNWSDLNNRGVARLRSGDYTGAVADFSAASELRPEATQVRRNLFIARRMEQQASPVASTR